MKRVFVKIFILDEVRVCEDYHLDEVRVVSMQQEDHVYVSKQQVLLYIHTHIHTYILTHITSGVLQVPLLIVNSIDLSCDVETTSNPFTI